MPKIYLAGRGSRYLEVNEADPKAIAYRKEVRRRLMSFHYLAYNKGDIDELVSCGSRGVDLFLDSGAFSAFTKGETIDNDEYIEWALASQDYFTVIAALDVIGDHAASWRNFTKGYRAGLPLDKFIPCFHYGEPYEALDHMVNACEYIAIGGVAQLGSGPKLMEWLDHIWSNYLTKKDGTAKIKVHGFAVTGFEAMLRYPWYSVDSSSWIMQAATGVCSFLVGKKTFKVCFTDTNASAKKVDGWHYDQLAPQLRKGIDGLMTKMGYTPDQAKEHYGWRFAINAATYGLTEQLGSDRYITDQRKLFA